MDTAVPPAALAALRAEVAGLRAAQARAERRARLSSCLALCAVGLTLLLNLRPLALAQTPGVSLASLLSRLSAVEQKTAPLSLTGTPGTFPATLTITGVNVNLVDGSGSTGGTVTDSGGAGGVGGPVHAPHLTGLGNLVIGYDAPRTAGDLRTGSHNLVLGDGNDYSGFGGLVAGADNTISGSYTSVSGGGDSAASGNGTSVSGGDGNVASGQFASVSGGHGNTAPQNFGAVSGGAGVYEQAAGGWAAGGSFSDGPGAYHSP